MTKHDIQTNQAADVMIRYAGKERQEEMTVKEEEEEEALS